MINKLDNDIFEVLPIARSDNGSSSAETTTYANDISLPTKCTSSALPRLILFRVIPLVLFAFIGGTNLINLYATDEALEDVEYRQTQLQQYYNSHEVNNASNAISNNSDYHPIRLPRWRKIGNDCAAGQRLANTTDLYCGVAPKNGKMMIEPLITNEHGTCGGIPLQPNYCLMPSRGQWTLELSNQTMSSLPRRFGTPYYVLENRSHSLSLCKSPNDFYNGTQQGSLEEFDREWVPNSCSVVPLNPFDWMQHSKCQVTIAMMGDSHIRNLFTATVHGLRGDSAFVESHPDNKEKDAGTILTYEWRKEGGNGIASDHFVVHTNTNNKNLTHILEDCPCNEESARYLRIVFIWAPRFDDQIKHVQLLSDLNPDLIILEPGNAYETSTVLSQEWTNAMDAILSQNEHRHMAILHFPYGPQPKERPTAINAWIGSSNNNATRGNNRMRYWEQGKLGLSGMQTRKTWHYACGLGRMQVRNDVVQAIELCTDEADTAFIRAITTVHFDAFREH